MNILFLNRQEPLTKSMSISSSEMTLLAAIEMSLELDKSRAALLTASGTEKIIARRQIGLDKIIHLLNAYQAKDDTVAFAISIFDRWLASDLHNETAANRVPTDPCECCAMACFLIAMKLREVESPTLQDMAHDGWSPAHIASCEQEVMFSLDWNVHSTTGIGPKFFVLPKHTIQDYRFPLVCCTRGATPRFS